MRLACLLGFQYQGEMALWGIEEDLKKMITACQHCCIYDILVITDIPGFNHPGSIILPSPDAGQVISQMANFVDFETRGISVKGEAQVLFYFSGHGDQFIGNITTPAFEGLRFVDSGHIVVLESRELFNLMFGLSSSDVFKMYKKQGKGYVKYDIKIERPPLNLKVKGLPSGSNLLAIIDTCHSEMIMGLPYKYSETEARTFRVRPGDDLPYCLSISACRVHQVTHSHLNGSYFTNFIYRLIISDKITGVAALCYYLNKTHFVMTCSQFKITHVPVLEAWQPPINLRK